MSYRNTPTDGFHDVRPDLVQVPASPEQRDAREEAALVRLYAILDPVMGAEVRRSLESPDRNEQLSITGIRAVPEAARLISEIYAIRLARRDDEILAEQQGFARIYPAPVVIALNRIGASSEYVASVVRTQAENFIILSAEATPLILAHALQMLDRSRAERGEFPIKGDRIDLRRGPHPPASPDEVSLAAEVLSKLPSAPEQEIAGVGRLPAVSITVGPVKYRRRVPA